MNFFSRLFGKKKPKPTVDEATLIEANTCPNCWGRMEYDDQFVEFTKDQTKSNINHDKTQQKAFVQQFVETHVTGIRLKRDGENLHCPKCKGKYKYSSSKAN